jgi:CHASE2 domain-containing sensor protein
VARFETEAGRRADWRVRALSALAALATTIALQPARLADRLDAVAFDLQVRLLRARGATDKVRFDPNVVIVGLDAPGAQAIDGPPSPTQQALGAALAGIVSAGPRITVIDVALPGGSNDSNARGLDNALVEGFVRARDASDIVLLLEPDTAGHFRPPPASLMTAASHADRAPAISVAAYPKDVDRVVRRHDPSTAPAGHQTFIGVIARRIGRAERAEQGGWIDFTRGAPFSYVPIEYVVRWHRTGDAERLRAVFAGRIVLIGAVQPRQNRWAQPVNLAGWQDSNDDPPGVVLHAQAVRTLIGAGFVQPIATWIAAGLAVALALLAFTPAIALNWALLAVGMLAAFAWTTVQHADGYFVSIGGAFIAGLLAAGIRTSIDLGIAPRARHPRARPASGSGT